MNVSAHPQTPLIQLEGVAKTASQGRFILLTASVQDAVNSLDNPTAVSPTETTILVKGKKIAPTLGAYRFCVMRIKLAGS